MPEEKEKTMVRGERRTAQRIKRVLADITPQHLEQLTKQARALTGDYEMVEVQGGASMEVIRARLSNLQQRHSTLRDKLTNAYPPHRDFDENMESEFRAGETERVFLEGESWNDDVITELQRRIWENGSTTRGEEDQDIQEKPELDEKPRESQSVTYQLHRKMIRGVSGGQISVRFDTGFGDEKYESYYCVLTSSSATDKLHVTEHSIPFFLPLRELEKAHLTTSPKVFIDYIGDILQAYVSRREQVREIKETKGESIGELYHSLSFSLIELMLKEPDYQVGVSLAYYNLKSELPTQSSVIAWSRPAELRPQTATKRQATTVHSSAFHLPKAEAFLLTIPLPKALDELLADLRATIGSPQSPAVIEATSLLPAETAL
ncbi:unnamed protein product [Sphagnum troendelagicum]|uniref:Centromere protein O n=1 Tax=Sphagnum troendelagicum TaxID=128251 RepID=A0ABP0UZB2_9BRYO